MALRFFSPLGSNTAPYDTIAKGATNPQTIADLTAADDEARYFTNGTHILAAILDFDTNSGLWANLINHNGCNAAGVVDGTPAIFDANSGLANCIKINKHWHVIKFFELKNATADAINATGVSANGVFQDLYIHNCGGSGINSLNFTDWTYSRCRFNDNTAFGLMVGTRSKAFFCETNRNSHGLLLRGTVGFGCVAHNNTTVNIHFNAANAAAIACVADGWTGAAASGDGIRNQFTGSIIACRITNCVTGINCFAGTTSYHNYCGFYGNTADTAVPGATVLLDGGDNVSMSDDGYVGGRGGGFTDNFNLFEDAELRRAGIDIDGTNFIYITGGIPGTDYMRPRITGISDPSIVLAGGQRTVKGGGFSGTTPVVKLDSAGGAACTVDSVIDDNEMLVTFPAQAAGGHKIYVQSDAGEFLSDDNLIKYLAMALLGVPTGQIIQAFNTSLLIQSSFVQNASGIKVFRDTDPGGAFPEITGSPFASYEILDDNNGAGLAENTPYYYKLKGTNSAGDSAFSAIFASRTIIGKAHPRTAIRDKAVLMLTNKVYFDGKIIGVHKTRFLPYFPGELPAIGVYILDEPADDEETAPREYARLPQLMIEICLKKNHIENSDDITDYIAKQVEDLFFIDNTMGDLVDDLKLRNTKLTPKIDGEDLYMGATMDWEIKYRTDAPEEQGAPLVEDLEKSFTQIGVGHDETPVDEHAIEAEIDHET